MRSLHNSSPRWTDSPGSLPGPACASGPRLSLRAAGQHARDTNLTMMKFPDKSTQAAVINPLDAIKGLGKIINMAKSIPFYLIVNGVVAAASIASIIFSSRVFVSMANNAIKSAASSQYNVAMPNWLYPLSLAGASLLSYVILKAALWPPKWVYKKSSKNLLESINSGSIFNHDETRKVLTDHVTSMGEQIGNTEVVREALAYLNRKWKVASNVPLTVLEENGVSGEFQTILQKAKPRFLFEHHVCRILGKHGRRIVSNKDLRIALTSTLKEMEFIWKWGASSNAQNQQTLLNNMIERIDKMRSWFDEKGPNKSYNFPSSAIEYRCRVADITMSAAVTAAGLSTVLSLWNYFNNSLFVDTVKSILGKLSYLLN